MALIEIEIFCFWYKTGQNQYYKFALDFTVTLFMMCYITDVS